MSSPALESRERLLSEEDYQVSLLFGVVALLIIPLRNQEGSRSIKMSIKDKGSPTLSISLSSFNEGKEI
jgi:hypothetical protein